MPAEQSYARLGAFIVMGLLVILATGVFFVERMKSRAVIALVTYFTEDVSGLDVSSPVRYRGVSVGRVSQVRVQADGTTIEVDFELFQDRLAAIGGNVTRVEQLADLPVARRLRARVVGNPITGEGYLLLDIPENPPPLPSLAFTPGRGYVPSMPSVFARVQDHLPELVERAQETFETLTTIVKRVPDSLDRTERFLNTIEGVIRESQLPQLSADLRTFSGSTTDQVGQMTAQVAQMTAQITQITANMDRLVGADGALMKFAEEGRTAIRDINAPASAQAAREAADRTIVAADDLRRSLPALLETLTLLRELTRHLDEQPESVIYGPRPPQATPQAKTR